MIEYRAMRAGHSIAVVMPAFNEERLVGATIAGVPRFVDQLIVVDDASTDATARNVRRADREVLLVSHQANRGAGAAIATGCIHALRSGADITVVMAGDGQMDPADLPALLEPLLTGEADFAKGNRLAWPGAREQMPLQRWIGNRLFSSVTRFAIGVDVRDSQCGYVAMNRHAMGRVQWDRLWSGYGYPNHLLSMCVERGLRVEEVPVRPIYGEERSGIGFRDVCLGIPFVIARAWLRACVRRRGLARLPAPG